MVTFTSNGQTCDGYIAGSGPGVLVIQEWWGLVPHITDVVDRLGAAGFTALAPDLYHGESSAEPDGAGKLMMALNLEQAVKDLSGAIDLLQERSGGGKIGVVGFCMGGALAIVAAAARGDAVAACAPYYGVIGWPSIQVDYSAITGRVVGEYAENDDFAGPDAVRAQESAMREAGVDVAMHIHTGAQHAFFNDTRPEVYHAAAASEAWARTLDLFRSTL